VAELKRQAYAVSPAMNTASPRNDQTIVDSLKASVSPRLPSRVKWLIVSNAFTSAGVGYLIVYITGYMPEVGFSSGTVGLLVGVFGLVTIVTGIPFGLISDRMGRKWLLLLGSIGVGPSLAIFALTSGLSYLLVSAILLGLAEAASLTTWNAIIADQTVKENRNNAFSWSFVVGTISFGVGSAVPFVFPQLQTALGVSSATVHQSFMMFFALLSVVTPVFLVLLLRNYAEVVRPGAKLLKSGPSMRLLLKFSGINSLIGLGAGFIIPLIPTWFYLKFAIPDTYSGPLLAVSNVTIGLSALTSSRLAKTYGQVNSIAMVTGSATVLMLSLAFVFNPLLAAGLYIARAALMNMASPLMDSYLMGIITVEERGLASAINSIIWRLPNSVSTVLGGSILESGMFDLPFYLAAGFYAVSVTLFYTVFRKVSPKN